jgi:hypothetical protein
VLGTPLRLRGAWAPTFGGALSSAHVALGLSAWKLATPPTRMWRAKTQG